MASSPDVRPRARGPLPGDPVRRDGSGGSRADAASVRRSRAGPRRRARGRRHAARAARRDRQEDRATGRRVFRFVRGPIFAHVVLADEVNRTPPKTQAALLQSMQEYRVSAGGQTYALPLPFLVFATQNPIEQEGTYPLPEAQLDRFMFQIDVGYPTAAEEIRIAAMSAGGRTQPLRKLLSPT